MRRTPTVHLFTSPQATPRQLLSPLSALSRCPSQLAERVSALQHLVSYSVRSWTGRTRPHSPALADWEMSFRRISSFQMRAYSLLRPRSAGAARLVVEVQPFAYQLRNISKLQLRTFRSTAFSRKLTENSWAAERLEELGEKLEPEELPATRITKELLNDPSAEVTKLAEEILSLNILEVQQLLKAVQVRLPACRSLRALVHCCNWHLQWRLDLWHICIF
jgi:hypothetical protein